MMRSIGVTLLLVLAGASDAVLVAQDPFLIERIERPPEIDGRLDEPVWASLAPLPMTMYKPTFGLAPSESTDVRVAHDGRALYVGAALYHRDPSGVKAWTRTRDQDDGGDFINVIIDTFNDSENAVTFSTTPAGPRLDFSVANDAEGDNSITNAWNGVWDVRARRDEAGWYAEFRIPFSTLRYQTVDGVVRMRLIVNRLIWAKNERVIFPAVQPRWAFGQFKPSQGREVEFRGVEARRQLLVTPYALGGHDRRVRMDPVLGQWTAGSDLRHEVGADLKLAVSNDVNLDLTANTDFAETEVDDQRLNLTRFPLLFPERRQFFIERAGVFSYDFDLTNRLFHSRRIGLADDGSPVRIYGGGRVVGRLGPADLGLLVMQAGQDGASLGENFAVARFRRRVFNAESYLGAMFTSRVGARDAAAGGIDGSLRLGGPYYARITAAASTTSPGPSTLAPATFDRTALGLRLERRTTQGVGITTGVLRIGKTFDPPIGFLEANGLMKADAEVAYGVFLPERSPLRVVTPAVFVYRVWDLNADEVQTYTASAELTAEFKSGAELSGLVERRSELVLTPLPLSETLVVPPGDYDDTSVRATAATATSGPVSLTGEGSIGGFYGGHRTSGRLVATWHPTPPLTMIGEYEHERLSIAGLKATLQLLRARAAVTWSRQLSTSVVVQHSTAAHLTSINARARFNFREGNDLWLVYTHGLNSDRDRITPTLPGTQARAVAVKYTYTFGH
ncbi:MAG TPA: DUF5916 domain-containing protein [Gemmatimonadales bacterium]|nr:DUF5916 domain-containing protein [Gemmatimonadales bacterium]